MNEEQRKTEVEKFMNYFVYINRPGADKLLEWLEQIGFFHSASKCKIPRSIRRWAGGTFKQCLPPFGKTDRRRGQATGQTVSRICS